MKTNVIRWIRTSAVLWDWSLTWSYFILCCFQLWCDVEPWALMLLLTAAVTHKLSTVCCQTQHANARWNRPYAFIGIKIFFQSSDFWNVSKNGIKNECISFFFHLNVSADWSSSTEQGTCQSMISGATLVPCKLKLKLCSTKKCCVL